MIELWPTTFLRRHGDGGYLRFAPVAHFSALIQIEVGRPGDRSREPGRADDTSSTIAQAGCEQHPRTTGG